MYIKQNFIDGNVLTAAQLNHMEEGIAIIGNLDEGLDRIITLQQQYLEAM